MLIVDLSSIQEHVDFARLKKAGIGAVWMKVSEGVTWNDPTWHDRAQAARKAGLRVGGYHYARPDHNPPSGEAAHFAEQLDKVGRRDLRPFLDYEQHPATAGWARTFNQCFKAKAKLLPAFYSYPAFIRDLNLVAPVGNGLLLASYGRNDGVEHPYVVPPPWKRVVAHQFTSNGKVPGVQGRVDLWHADRPPLAYPVRGLL